MPVIQSKKSFYSGVPLGAIGAGKMELLPNGLFDHFTFLNNWTHPLQSQNDFPGLLGYHLGIYVEERPGVRKSCLLQTVPVAGLPTVRSIRYEGHFPICVLEYEQPALGLQVTLEAFSPWSFTRPRDYSLPCSYFTLKVRNIRSRKVRVGLLFMGRNVSGDWCVGRQNRITEDLKAVHLEFLNGIAPQDDPKRGSLRWSFEKRGWRTSYFESWNAVIKNFHFNADDIRLSAWEPFSRTGFLPDKKNTPMVRGENQELCGAVAANGFLGRGEERAWSFSAAWHYPRHRFGHRYSAWFKDAKSVQRYAAVRRPAFRKKIDRFHALVHQFPFPVWFKDALVNNLSPFFASSWLVRDGRFAFYEAPVICPLMATLDVGFYGSIPLSYFYPSLEISQLMQFARAQRPDGYIPHDLGRNRVDTPSDGTTFYRWKDLNPKFVLMAYRDFLWSGDTSFLKKVYPHVKRALHWSIDSDTNGDGLPDHEGADQTFDLWDFKGANAYTAGIFLAALLAGRKMAALRHDAAFGARCQRAFRKGQYTMEHELWNGRYFGKVCALSQLNGQWYADLLRLGDIAEPRKVHTALQTILAMNSRPSRYGLVNSVLPDGRLDTSNNHAQNIWFGMNYAFISLCLLRGFDVKNVLKPAYSLWDNVIRRQRNPWNLPDMIDWKTGRFIFGDAYYRNMAIWSIPIALAERDQKTARILRALRSV